MRSRCRASTPSTGRASWPRWSIISRPRSRSARRRAPWISPCRPEISATFSPATSPSGWACRCGALRIAANVNDILPRTLKTGIYEVREVHASASPSMDIQVSSNFERLLFEASGRDAAGSAPADGVAETVRALRAAGCDAGRDPRRVRRRPRRRDRNRGRDPRRLARGRRSRRSPYRGGARGRRSRHRGFENSQHRAVDRACRQIPRCGGSRLRRAAATAGLARRV